MTEKVRKEIVTRLKLVKKLNGKIGAVKFVKTASGLRKFILVDFIVEGVNIGFWKLAD